MELRNFAEMDLERQLLPRPYTPTSKLKTVAAGFGPDARSVRVVDLAFRLAAVDGRLRIGRKGHGGDGEVDSQIFMRGIFRVDARLRLADRDDLRRAVSAGGHETLQRWLHGGYMTRKSKKPAIVLIAGFPY